MDGIQKTVHEGLLHIAERVENGDFGEDDDAFQDDEIAQGFLNDLHDYVLDKMQ